MIFKSAWWSVELPQQWVGSSDKDCETFCGALPLGYLQISAARKESDSVSDEDLLEFADEFTAPNRRLVAVKLTAFTGFTISYVEGGLFLQKWWLRSGELMLYVTYNIAQEKELREEETVQSILNSLRRLKGAG